MIQEKMKAQEFRPGGYEPPRTRRSAVVAESAMCAESSASIEIEEEIIEVEDYREISNEITFD